MLDPLSENTQCQSFNAGYCLLASTSVNHRPGYLGDLCDPSAIFLLLDLDSESHHAKIDERRRKLKPIHSQIDQNLFLDPPKFEKPSFRLISERSV